MQSILQILKLNEPRQWNRDGKTGESQDAECLLLTDTGDVDQVGVLRIPKDLRDKVSVGTFTGSFALRPNFMSRQIEAVLTGLTPLPPDYFKRTGAATSGAKSGA